MQLIVDVAVYVILNVLLVDVDWAGSAHHSQPVRAAALASLARSLSVAPLSLLPPLDKHSMATCVSPTPVSQPVRRLIREGGKRGRRECARNSASFRGCVMWPLSIM